MASMSCETVNLGITSKTTRPKGYLKGSYIEA